MSQEQQLTNLSRFQRHMGDAPLCPRCGEQDESTLHLLRDCRCLAGHWQTQQPPSEFYTEQDLSRWLRRYAPGKFGQEFTSFLWFIWKARNTLVFEQKQLPVYVILAQANAYCLDSRMAFHSLSIPHDRKPQRWVSWIPPLLGHFKLNTDGLVLVSGHAAAGGIIREHLGQWVIGFAVNIGITHCFEPELWGLLHGLRLCRSLGFTNLVVELDSSTIVELFQDLSSPPSRVLSTLLLECYNSAHLLPLATFQHRLGKETSGRFSC